MRWGVALLFVIGLTGCYVSGTSGERPGTTTSATRTVTQTYTVNTTDTDSLTYTLTVPATWMLVRGDGAELRFQPSDECRQRRVDTGDIALFFKPEQCPD